MWHGPKNVTVTCWCVVDLIMWPSQNFVTLNHFYDLDIFLSLWPVFMTWTYLFYINLILLPWPIFMTLSHFCNLDLYLWPWPTFVTFDLIFPLALFLPIAYSWSFTFTYFRLLTYCFIDSCIFCLLRTIFFFSFFVKKQHVQTQKWKYLSPRRGPEPVTSRSKVENGTSAPQN